MHKKSAKAKTKLPKSRPIRAPKSTKFLTRPDSLIHLTRGQLWIPATAHLKYVYLCAANEFHSSAQVQPTIYMNPILTYESFYNGQRHDQNGGKHVAEGEWDEEIVEHVAKFRLHSNGQTDEHVATDRHDNDGEEEQDGPVEGQVPDLITVVTAVACRIEAREPIVVGQLRSACVWSAPVCFDAGIRRSVHPVGIPRGYIWNAWMVNHIGGTGIRGVWKWYRSHFNHFINPAIINLVSAMIFNKVSGMIFSISMLFNEVSAVIFNVSLQI